jgi:hypothetical protein
MSERLTYMDRRTLLATGIGSILAAVVAGDGTPARAQASGGHDNMRVRFTFNSVTFTATLADSPSARDFLSLLPLDLTIENYADNEKIAYLPRKLTEAGSGPFGNEAAGDLGYYAPWGNLAFFYGGYRYSHGLIRLGRLDQGIEPLLTRGKFPLRAEILS